jgi:DNA-binding NarL/FixJ family response regulator
MDAPVTVYAVDDDFGVLHAVLAVLNQPGTGYKLMGAARDGLAAPELVADNAIDLFVCDYRLPGADGLDLIARAKELHPPVRTVLMTGYPSPELSIRAFAVGVDAFLFKPFDGPQLLASLSAARAGHRVFCNEAAGHVADFLRQQNGLAATSAEPLLHPHEIQVLRLLSSGKTAKEIAIELGLTPDTVATYRRNAYKKLNVHKLPEALNKLRGIGQTMVKPPGAAS